MQASAQCETLNRCPLCLGTHIFQFTKSAPGCGTSENVSTGFANSVMICSAKGHAHLLTLQNFADITTSMWDVSSLRY
jgi:hypothetical protein